ncbi:MAG: hypothetical protein COA57_00050 [Flavobacteriales bacterium]|nr:MAG: hypothetical protein COA57_00050 [Flavobacteriales bacterium]
MKKINFNTVLLIFFYCVDYFSQTPADNLQKYWNYRDRLRQYFILLLLGCLFLPACKKYPEGGTKWNRKGKIAGASWTIQSYTVDGADSLGYLNDSIFNCSEYHYIFSDDEGDFLIVQTSNTECINVAGGEYTLSTGNWGFDSKDIINIATQSIDSLGGKLIFPGQWSILKLTNSDLWLEKNMNNKLYEIHFLD